MATDDTTIIMAFLKEKELTIHQLSRIIGKSYAFTNKRAHLLISEGVLSEKQVGSAILCRLNFSSERTIATLVFNSILRRAQYPAGASNALIDKCSGLGVLIHFDRKLLLITDRAFPKLQINAVSESDFLKDARHMDLSSVIVLCNHEAFWRLVSRADA